MGSNLGFLAEPVASLVHIHCRVPDSHPSVAILGNERSGSGTVVGEGGYVLTVGYIVLGAEELQVVSGRGKSFQARIVHMDFESGLTVIQAPGLDSPPASVASAGELEVGTRVVLLASNGEEQVRGSEGLVADLGPFDAHWEYVLDSAIRCTAMNPGLGGGMLVTFDGRVRGTVSLNLNLVGVCSLSIPSDLFLQRRRVFFGEDQKDAKSQRPWLGLFPQPLERGVLVAGVVPGGPADTSGIEAGDVLLSINGHEVHSRRAFYEKLWEGKAGDAVTLTVYRGKSFRTLRVKSQSRAEFFR